MRKRELTRRIGASLTIAFQALSGEAKRRAWKDFEAGSGWYRGAAVDQLSEEEAAIIARRWVTRIREKISLAEPKTDVLQKEFAGVVRLKLLGHITRAQGREEMLNICREHLNEKDVAGLMEAFAEDLRSATATQ